jgi:hypothetical protein
VYVIGCSDFAALRLGFHRHKTSILVYNVAVVDRSFMSNSLFPQDNSDIVLLACRAQAKEGGNSACASSHAVHNEILATRPDLHKVTWAAKPFRLLGL